MALEDDVEFKRHINRSGHDGHRDEQQFTEKGYIPFDYNGEIFQVYYEVAGNIKTSTKTPLVTVHGGPGFSSFSLHPHSDLELHYNIPVILYDQTGGGRSTHLPDKPAEFWSIELFWEELKQVLQYFKIQDNYSLLGHSSGGVLSGYFAQTYIPHGLRCLVLVGAPASLPLAIEGLKILEEDLPERCKVALAKKKKGEEYNKEDAELAGKLFFRRYVLQLEPFPPEIVKMLEIVNADPSAHDIL